MLPSNVRGRLTFSHLSSVLHSFLTLPSCHLLSPSLPTLLTTPPTVSPFSPSSQHRSPPPSHFIFSRWLGSSAGYSCIPPLATARGRAPLGLRNTPNISHLLTVSPSLPRALPEATAYRRLKNTSVSFFAFTRCPNFQTMPSVLWVIQLLNTGKIMVMLKQNNIK